MKHLKHPCLIAGAVLAIALLPTPGWSSRVFADRVSGEVTAVPVSDVIEVDHHLYRIRAGSLADKQLHSLSQGQKIELVLDGSADNKASEVVLINVRDAQGSTP
jgi:hypothetical protein